MEAIKWLGYIVVSIIGVSVAAGVIVLLNLLGGIIGALALGGIIVLLVASAIKEYFESPKK